MVCLVELLKFCMQRLPQVCSHPCSALLCMSSQHMFRAGFQPAAGACPEAGNAGGGRHSKVP